MYNVNWLAELTFENVFKRVQERLSCSSPWFSLWTISLTACTICEILFDCTMNLTMKCCCMYNMWNTIWTRTMILLWNLNYDLTMKCCCMYNMWNTIWVYYKIPLHVQCKSRTIVLLITMVLTDFWERSHWRFGKLFQSSKLKARTCLFHWNVAKETFDNVLIDFREHSHWLLGTLSLTLENVFIVIRRTCSPSLSLPRNSENSAHSLHALDAMNMKWTFESFCFGQHITLSLAVSTEYIYSQYTHKCIHIHTPRSPSLSPLSTYTLNTRIYAYTYTHHALPRCLPRVKQMQCSKVSVLLTGNLSNGCRADFWEFYFDEQGMLSHTVSSQPPVTLAKVNARCVYVYAFKSVFVYAYICICVCMSICIFIYNMYVHIYIYICIYIHLYICGRLLPAPPTKVNV